MQSIIPKIGNTFTQIPPVCDMLSANRRTFFFYDNRDNSDNGKNGRNGLCHEETYNWDNKITVANSIFSQAQGNFSSTR